MIDPYKPVRLRNGQPVTHLICGQPYQDNPYCISGVAKADGLYWERCVWTRDGKFCVGDSEPNPYDLVEVRQ